MTTDGATFREVFSGIELADATDLYTGARSPADGPEIALTRRAAEIAEAYALLERSSALNTTRLKATGELIDRLDVAFTHYAATLQDADLDNLDIELKLLKNSLDADLGPALGAGIPLDPGKRRA